MYTMYTFYIMLQHKCCMYTIHATFIAYKRYNSVTDKVVILEKLKRAIIKHVRNKQFKSKLFNV